MEATWDPTAYRRFADERRRALGDLVAQVHCDAPRLVVDLGCGDGPATLALSDVWPDARLVGVDSSEAMLAAAREVDVDGRVEWVRADLRDWDMATLGRAPDVVVTNAVLQWIPEHLALIDAWVPRLAPSGWFAMQVPHNFDAPSHRLLREVAARHPRARELTAALDRPETAEAATYLRCLARLGCRVDAWETSYVHVLDPGGASENPVLDWVSGTALRPVLDRLPDAQEREQFLEEYGAALQAAYPRTNEGVLFPFRRVFAVAQRTVAEATPTIDTA
jgi:trans-aconitate 2-methyltransferase